jgi:hypothetical protein
VRWEDRQPGADNVMTLLQAWWPQPFATDKADFLQRVAAAPALDFAQLGQHIASMPAAAPAVAAAAAGSNGAASSSGAAASEVKLYHSRLADTPDWFKVRHWWGRCVVRALHAMSETAQCSVCIAAVRWQPGRAPAAGAQQPCLWTGTAVGTYVCRARGVSGHLPGCMCASTP